MIRHLFATPSNPVRLVKPDEAAATAAETAAETAGSPTAQAVLEVATNWWVMIPLLLVGTAAIMTVQLRIARARRLPEDERAFRALARAARLPGSHTLMARVLAKAHPDAAPVAMLLSDHALRNAAGRVELKPRSAGARVLRQVLEARGVDAPPPGATPARAPSRGARKTGATPPKNKGGPRRLSLRA